MNTTEASTSLQSKPAPTRRFRRNGQQGTLVDIRNDEHHDAVLRLRGRAWTDLDDPTKLATIREVMDHYGWTFTREQDITFAKGEAVDEVLEAVSGHAAKAGNRTVYKWALSARQGSHRRCANRYALYRWQPPKVTASWIDCRRRACDYCGLVRTWREVKDLFVALSGLGLDIHRLETTKANAKSVVTYATRKGFHTVTVPVGEDATVVYTTMPRKDTMMVWAVEKDGDDDPVRAMVLEDFNPDFEDTVYRDVVRIPAYRKGDEVARRVKMNKSLKDVVEGVLTGRTDRDREGRREPEESLPVNLDQEAAKPLSRVAIDFAVANAMVTETWPGGEIKTIDTSKVSDPVGREFIGLMDVRPRPRRVSERKPVEVEAEPVVEVVPEPERKPEPTGVTDRLAAIKALVLRGRPTVDVPQQRQVTMDTSGHGMDDTGVHGFGEPTDPGLVKTPAERVAGSKTWKVAA